MTIFEQAAPVLYEEARAIADLSSRLYHPFVSAVSMVLACKGRVVCWEMGKSGHIGRNIAFTLLSTGPPALCLQPVEGVHGAGGMISDDHVVFAFSNSGDTGENISILPS